MERGKSICVSCEEGPVVIAITWKLKFGERAYMNINHQRVGPRWTRLALSSHSRLLSVCSPLLQRWGHLNSCFRLPQSTVLVIIVILPMHDSRVASGLLLLLLASVVKEPSSASWAGLTQVLVCGHETCKCQRRTLISVGQVPWL